MVGDKQKLLQHEEEARAKRSHASGKLSRVILDLWCTGQLSAAGLQRIAEAAWSDGVRCNSILTFAKVGSWGEHASNVHGQILRHLDHDSELPTPRLFQVPALDSKAPPPRGHRRYARFAAT